MRRAITSFSILIRDTISYTLEQYIEILNEDPGGSPADAVGTNCYEWVIVPPSHRWFVHCQRSSEDAGGHLWLPEKWIEDAQNTYRWL